MIPDKAFNFIFILDLFDHPPHPCIIKVDFFEVVACDEKVLAANSLPRTEDSSYNFLFCPLDMCWRFGFSLVPDSKRVIFRGRCELEFVLRTVKGERCDAGRVLPVVLYTAKAFNVIEADCAVSTSSYELCPIMIPLDGICCVFRTFSPPVD